MNETPENVVPIDSAREPEQPVAERAEPAAEREGPGRRLLRWLPSALLLAVIALGLLLIDAHGRRVALEGQVASLANSLAETRAELELAHGHISAVRSQLGGVAEELALRLAELDAFVASGLPPDAEGEAPAAP